MRIGFDTTCIKHPMGGYERYARSLLAALAELDGDHELVVFTERGYGATIAPASRRIRCQTLRTLPRFIAKVLVQDQLFLPVLLRFARLDLVHTPIFAGMALAPRPYVLTVHDLIPLRLPEALTRSAAFYWRTVLPRAVARADVVITDSEFSRREIIDHFGLASERVVAVPLGVEARFRPVDDARTLASVRRRYALPERFLLFVGIASPRKNLDRLVRAFDALPEESRRDAHLVLAGPPGWKHAALDAALAKSRAASRFHRLGVVPDGDLPVLYSLASGAVSLSSYEGFGLPALEALACGTPLVCAETSAFPEVVGDGAWLVDPRDEAAVTAALATVLAGGPEVAARRQRGRARAVGFTWERTARATLAIYRNLVG